MTEVLLLAIAGLFNIICFVIGAKVGQTIVKGEKVETPNLNPFKAYRENQARKVAEMKQDKLVNDYKTATGQPLTGSQPFGWTIAKDETTGRKKVVKDPDEAPILEEAIQHYMTYQSKRKTVTYLHSKYHVGLTSQSFGILMRNTMLYGAYRDNPSYCEAYIDKGTYDKLNDILDRNCKENTAENRTYYFTGLIRCPHCSRILAGQMATSTKKKEEKTLRYKYKKYRCPKHRTINQCVFSKAISEAVLEKLLLKNLEQYIEDAKIRSLEITDSNEEKVLKYDIDELNAELERLNYSWKKGRIKGGIEQYDKEYDELIEKIELAKQEKENTEPKDFSKTESVLHEGWREIYKALDDEHKKAFWRSIISSIEIEWTTDVKRITKVNFF